MKPSFYIAFAVLISAMVASNYLAQRAVRLLSKREKLALVDSFPRLRVFAPLALVGIVLLFFGLRLLPAGWIGAGYYFVWALIAAWFAVYHRIISKRLRELKVNKRYLKAYSPSRWIYYAGFFLFFVIITFLGDL